MSLRSSLATRKASRNEAPEHSQRGLSNGSMPGTTRQWLRNPSPKGMSRNLRRPIGSSVVN
eukprot:7088630-Pyramimonas_sp.AAC.1